MPVSNSLPARSRRPPRKDQRVWRNMNVDKQLEDAWLEAFNSLIVYDLISICTGHPVSNGFSNPHINFRLKPEWFFPDWERFIKSLEKLHLSLVGLFKRHDCVKMEYKKIFSGGRIRLHDVRQDLVISIRPRLRREINDFDDTTREWFEKMVLVMQGFDLQSRQILEVGNSRGDMHVETLDMKKYFAYGSNMDWKQMSERCPSARFLTVAVLPDHQLAFSRVSTSRGCGVADVVPCTGSGVWGVVYEISADDLCKLDRTEGFEPGREKNCYIRTEKTVYEGSAKGSPLNVSIYFAVPQPGSHFPNKKYLSLI
ncbi:MAG: gamma-glutamylcyclotransferase family protein, partial [Candidatus Riflebacteria bacterium]